MTAPDLIFSKVTPSEAKEAFAFHSSIAGSDAHIWPRSQEQLEEMANQGELFGVHWADTNEFVGLCYVHYDEENDQWELGGLTVPAQYRGSGIGLFLVRFAVAHSVAMEQPFQNNQPVIAHVHVENPKPRNVLVKAGFFETDTVATIPAGIAPPSMKCNANGEVEGNVYSFDPFRVRELASWLESFAGTLESGKGAQIRLGAYQTLDALRQALRETAQDIEAGRVKVTRVAASKETERASAPALQPR